MASKRRPGGEIIISQTCWKALSGLYAKVTYFRHPSGRVGISRLRKSNDDWFEMLIMALSSAICCDISEVSPSPFALLLHSYSSWQMVIGCCASCFGMMSWLCDCVIEYWDHFTNTVEHLHFTVKAWRKRLEVHLSNGLRGTVDWSILLGTSQRLSELIKLDTFYIPLSQWHSNMT